jgi:hypothetical protein
VWIFRKSCRGSEIAGQNFGAAGSCLEIHARNLTKYTKAELLQSFLLISRVLYISRLIRSGDSAGIGLLAKSPLSPKAARFTPANTLQTVVF